MDFVNIFRKMLRYFSEKLTTLNVTRKKNFTLNVKTTFREKP